MIIINVKNSFAAEYFVETMIYVFFLFIFFENFEFNRTEFIWNRNILRHYKCVYGHF